MISYAMFIYSGNFQRLLNESTDFQNFYLHGKENSRGIWTFRETSMTIHFKLLDD